MELINPNLSGRSHLTGSDAVALTGSATIGTLGYYGPRAWSVGPNAPTNQSSRPAVLGNSSAAMVFGGSPSFNDTTIEWDGTAWAAGTSYPIPLSLGAGAGTADDGIGHGGFCTSPNAAVTATNHWNGTSWSSGGNTSIGRHTHALGGNSGNAVVASGRCDNGPFAVTNTAETYNGTAWSSATNAPQTRHNHKAYGISSAYMHVGDGNGNKPNAEEYNGTAWSTGGAMSIGSRCGGGGGTATDAIYTLGQAFSAPTVTSCITCLYNGSTWSVEATKTNNNRNYGSGGGDSRCILTVGGFNVGALVEIFESTFTASGLFEVTPESTTASGSFSGSFFGSHLNINQANVFKFDCGSCVDDIASPRNGMMSYGHRAGIGYGLYYYSASQWRNIDLV